MVREGLLDPVLDDAVGHLAHGPAQVHGGLLDPAARKAVDRAKGILQKELGLSEPDAFRWIQRTAMDLRRSMREVAEGVVEHGVG